MARKKSGESSASSVAKAIRQCVDSGKVVFGSNRSIKKALSGKAKMLVMAGNCPKDLAQDALRFCKISGVPILKFGGTSVELGTVAGRPHPVALLVVLDAGNSEILELAK
ncbi:MAG: 50S ribosomal protein L30e [Candidatus Micrarchaeota archaeon]|nr:50S ribosomal protein L30e [Candidatus Micrarchaeota archaeon]